jgi:hypothetical protein
LGDGFQWWQLASRWYTLLLALIALFAASILPQPALAQFVQQGPKLVGTGASGAAAQGESVALSGDGNTAVMGGSDDDSSAGAAWIFNRFAGVWTQHGEKLVGSGAIGAARQGRSVAVSADGKTVMIGGNGDNNFAGAAWIFNRVTTSVGFLWIEQAKLIGSTAIGNASQGGSVALSADGNTAIMGGFDDNGHLGAAWIFTRSGSTWTEQAKLVGTGAVGTPDQGFSVAISGDGDTAILGGPTDNGKIGAAWVFTRSGATWTQQGSKLVGTGGVGTELDQGWAVALSGDGNTALVGGIGDNSSAGATWVFTRSGGTWTQQGGKLVGTGTNFAQSQGVTVSLSTDGNTALVGSEDGGSVGAAWVFKRNGSVWTQYGSKLVGSGAVGEAQQAVVALAGSGNTAIIGGLADDSFVGAAWVFVTHAAHDFDDDRLSDILWHHSNGSVSTWQMAANGTHTAFSFGTVNTSWQIAGTNSLVASTGYVNGGGKSDIFWRNTNGSLSLWELGGGTSHTPISLGTVITAWQIAGVGDFDGDGHADILWRHTNGSLSIWKMAANGTHTVLNFGVVNTAWHVAGIGDVNHDGKADIIWRHTNGSLSIWQMNGGTSHTVLNLGTVVTAWQIVGVGDVDGDGNADLFWRHTNGSLSIWKMAANGTHTVLNPGVVVTAWQVVSIGDYNGDGLADILWRHTNGSVSIWTMNANGTHTALSLGTVATAWTIVE